MSGDITTLRGSFPVEDITFKGGRKQSDILNEIDTGVEENPQVISISGVPQVITIERAIRYYEENAEGEFAKLYSATAMWLRDLMTAPKKSDGGVTVEVEEKTDSTED